MGAYYIFANLTKRVYLEPDDVIPGTAKHWQVINTPEVTSLLAWALLGPWRGDHVVGLADEGETAAQCDEVEPLWSNVTAELLAAKGGA